MSEGGAYASGPWSGPHLHFPGGKRWNLEHRLGFTPRRVGVYLAIPAESRELTPCAGNTCVFCVDDQYVWLRNDTCAEFWVRVEADGEGPAAATPRCEGDRTGPSDDAVDGATTDGAARDDATLNADTSPSDATLNADTSPSDATLNADGSDLGPGVL